MFILHAACLTVPHLPQPVTAVEQVQVCLAAGAALLLTHGRT
jgi:hypothetical protein